MAKFSKPVMVVLALAVLAVVASVAGLGGVAYMSYRHRVHVEEMRSELAALDAALEQYRLSPGLYPPTQGDQASSAGKSKVTRSRLKAGAQPDSADQAAPEQGAAEGRGDQVKIIQGEDGNAVVTQTGPGQFHMTFTGPTGGSPHSVLGMVPLAGRVKSMPLDDGQRAAIQAFEQAFEASASPRYEQAGNAMSEAFQALRAAQESKDDRLISVAQEQLRHASREQMETVQELNRQYLDGVRPYLSEEQVKELQRIADRKSGGASGFVSVQVNGEKPTVTVIQSDAGDGAGETPAEPAQP